MTQLRFVRSVPLGSLHNLGENYVILLKENKIYVDGKLHIITGFEVWFIVPDGICTTIAEALEQAEKYNFDPVLIKAVSVAVSRGTDVHYEIFMR